jgi:hypothetical protein
MSHVEVYWWVWSTTVVESTLNLRAGDPLLVAHHDHVTDRPEG